MRITLNGDPHELDGPLTVTALLAALAIDPRRVAVEHNLTVLKRATFDTVVVNEGDQVEIVNFVGGGEGRSGPRPRVWPSLASAKVLGRPLPEGY
jgi:thiamine biosynthesis protein ThiS